MKKREKPVHKQNRLILPVLGIGVLIVLFGLGGRIYYLETKQTAETEVLPTSPPTIKATTEKNPTVPPTKKTLQPEQVWDLGLIKRHPDPLNPQDTTDVTYYAVGEFREGTYKGYKRIVAIIQALNPSGAQARIFATKDNVSYVLSGNPKDATKYPEDDWNNPYYLVIKDKISAIVDLSDHPEIISLNANFLLMNAGVYTVLEHKGNEYRQVLPTDFSTYQPLSSSNPSFAYYGKQLERNPLTGNYSSRQKNDENIKEHFLSGTTQVIVVDAEGLPYSYALTTPTNAMDYQNRKVAYDLNPSASPFPLGANLSFKKVEVTPSLSLYETYNQAFPHACGVEANSFVVKNVKDTDFTKIGTVHGVSLYTLSDTNHRLYTLAYDYKVLNFPDATSFEQMNKKPQPSREEYMAKTPIVFFQDPWNRWVALGEYDYQLMGGCGKPVLYLYPTKPTTVSVTFVRPVQFSTAIPSYHNGWKVYATPQGVLSDLQPEYTDCNHLDAAKRGSEYAKEACLNQTYPYLYWAGQSFGASYPPQLSGWIVSRESLGAFLQQKLSDLGFTEKESADMRSYWVPTMLSHAVPYYRVSFLQTEEMNALIPMRITPPPDTLFRVFLDWAPLASKPSMELPPQALTPISRAGFTVVEWGGLH